MSFSLDLKYNDDHYKLDGHVVYISRLDTNEWWKQKNYIVKQNKCDCLRSLLLINTFNTRSVGWNIFIHHKYQVSSYVSPFRDDLLILTKMICWERVQAGAARLHNLMRRFMRNGADILPSNIKLWVIALMRCPGKKCQYVKV